MLASISYKQTVEIMDSITSCLLCLYVLNQLLCLCACVCFLCLLIGSYVCGVLCIVDIVVLLQHVSADYVYCDTDLKHKVILVFAVVHVNGNKYVV